MTDDVLALLTAVPGSYLTWCYNTGICYRRLSHVHILITVMYLFIYLHTDAVTLACIGISLRWVMTDTRCRTVFSRKKCPDMGPCFCRFTWCHASDTYVTFELTSVFSGPVGLVAWHLHLRYCCSLTFCMERTVSQFAQHKCFEARLASC